MTVSFEVVSVGAVVTARILLQGNSFTREVARLSLTAAHWQDFADCLHKPPRDERGRIVFAPVPKVAPPSDEVSDSILCRCQTEAVA
jgi:hypothetical protein